MAMEQQNRRVVTASRLIHASPETIFALTADPARQPEWDGNDNLASSDNGQRITSVGDSFTMTLTQGAERVNHVVEFDEGRRIAWKPAPHGEAPPGHLWRWELNKGEGNATLVTHTYDWTELNDETRLPRARTTRSNDLHLSLVQLAALAEQMDNHED